MPYISQDTDYERYDNAGQNDGSTPDIGGGLMTVGEPSGPLGGGSSDSGGSGISIGPSLGSGSGSPAAGGGGLFSPSSAGSSGGGSENYGGKQYEPGGSSITATPKTPSTPGLSSGAVSKFAPPAQSKGVIPFTPMGAPTRPKSSLFGGLQTGLTKGGFGAPQFGGTQGSSIDQLIAALLKRQKQGLF